MSDVEWVEESDWSKVNVGDRVKILSAPPEPPIDIFEFTVRSKTESPDFLGIIDYVLFVERPIVKSPNDPYTSHTLIDKGGLFLYRAENGYWFTLGEPIYRSFEDVLAVPGDLRVISRPVDEVRAETAKEIFARLEILAIRRPNAWGPGADDVLFEHNYFDRVAAEFGVTDE